MSPGDNMASILAELREPGWWFSVVLVAIVASVIAGFLKDIIARRLSKTSTWFRRRAQLSAAKQESIIQVLVAHPDVLSSFGIETILDMFVFGFATMNFMVQPVW